MISHGKRSAMDTIIIGKNVECGMNAEHVFDSVSIAMGILNDKSVLVYCNPAFAEFCGYGRMELRGKNIIGIFQDLNVAELYLEEIGAFLNSLKISREISFDMPDGNGKYLHIRMVIDPLRYNGKTGWKICTLLREVHSVDTKEVAKVEKALPAVIDSTCYRSAIESIKSLLRTRWWSAQLLCTVIVRHMAELFTTPVAGICFIANNKIDFGARYENGDVVSEDIVHLVEHVASLICREQRLSIHYGDIQTRFQHLSGKGNVRLNALMGVPLYTMEGNVSGVLYVAGPEGRFFDRTDMDILEILVWYVSVAFERFTAENVSHSDENEINLLYSVFSGLVHEVRNPLTGIILLTEAIRNDFTESPEYTHYFSLIKQQAHRLSSLMQQLLSLSQPVKTRKCTLEMLVEICNDAILACAGNQSDCSNSIRLLEPETYHAAIFLADRDRLKYAVEQILLNALQHSLNPSEIIVDVGEVEKSVYIKVIDQGQGIPGDFKHRIFEPFFTTQKKQNGLGLSIVKRIMDAHGGSVSIRNNKYSSGCTAELRIPLIRTF